MHYGIFWLCTGLLLLAGGQLTEATEEHKYYHNETNPGKCTLSDSVVLSPGESAESLVFCGRLVCETEEGLAVIYTCGKKPPKDGCQWGDYKDGDARYPECCDRHEICPEEEAKQ